MPILHHGWSLAFRWLGRLLAIALFLFWGTFFVEHLSEWFLRPDGRFPPAWVWVSQLFHLAMLVGLALLLRWERWGMAVLAVGMLGFCITIADFDVVRIVLVNLLPILCLAFARWAGQPARRVA